ncbi:hypothetical protein [Heyndrickxia sporothermodurans]|uniref:Uncharacterized protein n=1 Tax=Heyndrickxia sporothermodurans TaxID=46224 RepID=A0A150L7F1_9BACI|nr:hypothetical protein [Heyndrickxia sporothermodurans]KYD07936.1 hypothetical protein B4102_0570 [Heyndrickxia sporothermodurans]MED3651712.1 hypothetical protein [Heyndrickxia sporothermodurans]MED3699335.1 hypothetical protein [Heyndrickxia sporothermodurans]MED3779869.1 hypothetical protein [Heyndrickxia sporothermodurans]PTY77587.1 hypothetical protein B5V89_14150 [Heyndrickxia sporothermodurans]
MLNPKKNVIDHEKDIVVQEKGQFIEILGDTTSSKQLIVAILMSVVVSLGGYKLGQYIFPKIASPQMVNSYSLLLGIAGTVIVLFLNAVLFKPKRILVEDEISNSTMEDVFKDLQLDIDEELRLIDADPITKRELNELGVLANFENMRRVNKK